MIRVAGHRRLGPGTGDTLDTPTIPVVAGGVELFAWNPRRPVVRGPLGKLIQRPVNNFGDLLGPIVVTRLLGPKNTDRRRAMRPVRLFSVGSVLHYAADGDVVWGSGVNGKVPIDRYQFHSLDVRAVRGPLTRDFLRRRGVEVPEIYGDPALLLPDLIPELRRWASDPAFDVTYVPNLNDFRTRRQRNALDPRSPLATCLERIARSRLVVGSSLHALIVAEALGIPARGIRSSVEHELKYADYYLGTGRGNFALAGSVDEAIEMGGEPPLDWSASDLLRAFPYDLWSVPGE